jgi:signal transduction histidine kinase
LDDPARLRRVLTATHLIAADVDLTELLGHILDEARSMTSARYGALGVLSEDGTSLVEFITAGLNPDEEIRIGSSPTGIGVLGVLIADPAPLRIPNLGAHPASSGFPAHHPPMTSFLGVPIIVRDSVYGNLYLTDKVESSEFSDGDEALVCALAVVAGIAIENARLHHRAQQAAVAGEREKFASELHETVLQRLEAARHHLAAVTRTIGDGPLTDHLREVASDLDGALLRLQGTSAGEKMITAARPVRARIDSLLAELKVAVGMQVRATFNGSVEALISDKLADHILATVRESVTNVGLHSGATRADVLITVDDGRCRLRVIDNGRGVAEAKRTHEGPVLNADRLRMEKRQGDFNVSSPATGGTVSWQVPLGVWD